MTSPEKISPIRLNSVTNVSQIQAVVSTAVSQPRQDLAKSGRPLPSPEQSGVLNDVKKKELSQAVKHISGFVQNITRELYFSIDEESEKTVVTVVDESTGDVIRQIPTEDMLELARDLTDIKEKESKGLLFRGDA